MMLSWKRTKNIQKIIDSIRNQSVETEIFLWNNDEEDEEKYPVDLQINSSVNLMCWTRWLLLAYASGNYVCTIDDDLCFLDSDVLKDGIEYCKKNDCAVGGFGAILNSERDYQMCQHLKVTIPSIKYDTEVDVLKGRFILTPIHLVANMLIRTENSTISSPRIEDDIIVSSHIEKKIIPKIFIGRLKELPTYEQALMNAKDHISSREKARRKYLD
jgi:hypothetical protein